MRSHHVVHLVHRLCVGAMFTIAREAMAQWRRRVRTHNRLTTLSNGDLLARRRAELEAERCKAFLWA
jgi:hypothetical protein